MIKFDMVTHFNSDSEWLLPVVSVFCPPLANVVSKSLDPGFCEGVVGIYCQDDMLILVLMIVTQSNHLVAESEVGEGWLVGAEVLSLVL